MQAAPVLACKRQRGIGQKLKFHPGERPPGWPRRRWPCVLTAAPAEVARQPLVLAAYQLVHQLPGRSIGQAGTRRRRRVPDSRRPCETWRRALAQFKLLCRRRRRRDKNERLVGAARRNGATAQPPFGPVDRASRPGLAMRNKPPSRRFRPIESNPARLSDKEAPATKLARERRTERRPAGPLSEICTRSARWGTGAG